MFAPLVARSSKDPPRPRPALRLGPADGPLEREADRIAAGVVEGAGPAPAISISPAPVPADRGSAHPSAPGAGEALRAEDRGFFESRFGRDFSAVRVHRDGTAGGSARALGARAYTSGSDIVFGAGHYAPGTRTGLALLAHELTHVVQQGGRPGLVQRSPLSDSVKAAWDAEPSIEALLARLGQPDVQAAQGDSDVDSELAALLAKQPDDLWVAQRIRKGELGRTTGAFGPKDAAGKPVARPVQAFFFRGSTDRRALVIAGVHGSERQGMEVVEMLMAELRAQPTPPAFTIIIVPSLFPDAKARGDALAAKGKAGMSRIEEAREGATPTNRNFPDPSKDLAAAGGVKAVDKMGRAILPENRMLMELMERFHPERIISVHGTHGPGSAGVFYDKRQLRDDELAAAASVHVGRSPSWEDEGGAEARLMATQKALFGKRSATMLAEAEQTDRDLSLKAAEEIDKATAGIAGRDSRRFGREGEAAATTKANLAVRKKHPSVAGNVGPTGKFDNATWSGSSPGGVSLGGYATARGMSVFTVEPPLNYRSDDPSRLEKLSAAERKVELKAYAEAIRTVLLGTP